MSGKVKKLWRVCTTALVALTVVLAVLLAGVRLFGLTPYCVLSGSMEPAYPVGSLIYVQNCAASDVQVGDAITFVLNEDLELATHRVVAIDAERRQFTTQGDANDAPDGTPVAFENLVGKPVFAIPYLGYVSQWITNPPGMYLAIAAGVVLVLLLFLPDLLRAADRADRRAAEKTPPDSNREGEPR